MTTQETPMFLQYNRIKEEHADAILLFRLGDFYEMFGQDAETASRDLQITLTSREGGGGERIPMCGVPYHALEGYLAELVAKGHKVAICEQLEEAGQAKGVVRRGVVRVVTPGTVVSPALEAKRNNFLAALVGAKDAFGLALMDASTGEFAVTQLDGERARNNAVEELIRAAPAEVLLGPGLARDAALQTALGELGAAGRVYEERAFQTAEAYRMLTEHFQTSSLEAFGCDELPLAIAAAGAALRYLGETHRTALKQVTTLTTYAVGNHMVLDRTTRANLELTRTLRDQAVRGSLLWVLDQTMTAMGGRLLRRWLEQPLLQADTVNGRLQAVADLAEQPLVREDVRRRLDAVADLERLMGRIAYGSATARDLVALKTSLQALPPLRDVLVDSDTAPLLQTVSVPLDGLPQVADDIALALVDTPPPGTREGGLIRDGYNDEVDALRSASRDGKAWIARLEAAERERTGIKSLKVGFNKVFGYYIEVTRPNLELVPDDYQRKQTLANAERFITPDLKQTESQILGAEERVIGLEYELFCDLRERVAAHSGSVQQTARAVAELDVLAGLAEVAFQRGYCRPEVTDAGEIAITGGRHPVVEVMLEEFPFVPNDACLDDQTNQLMVLTGPNMAGKSTYLRQVALIVLMAQVGSFVPAAAARVGIVDRIFTRVGAADDLGTGRSTFMVEMSEAAHILHHAGSRSLVVIDELGRGTSTYDGMALTQAIAEYIHDSVGAKTIISTHYHELTLLEDTLARARNYRTEVREHRGRVSFLYQVGPGAADKSYGINVARMAGIPRAVIGRAQKLLHGLETAGGTQRVSQLNFAALFGEAAAGQEEDLTVDHLVEDEVLTLLRGVDISNLSPLEALNRLAEWQQRLGRKD